MKILFYLKQLIPLRYTTKYTTPNGIKYTATWRMWLGKAFNAKHVKA